VQTVLGKPTDPAAACLQFDRNVEEASAIAPQGPTDPFGQSMIEAQPPVNKD